MCSGCWSIRVTDGKVTGSTGGMARTLPSISEPAPQTVSAISQQRHSMGITCYTYVSTRSLMRDVCLVKFENIFMFFLS